MSTLAEVEKVLRDTGEPMSVREIVEAAGDSLPTKSKTPDTVVARDLSMDIKKKGEASLFIRTSPGRYTMREIWAARQAAAEGSAGDEATEVLSRAIKHDRQATLAAKRAQRPGAAEQNHQG